MMNQKLNFLFAFCAHEFITYILYHENCKPLFFRLVLLEQESALKSQKTRIQILRIPSCSGAYRISNTKINNANCILGVVEHDS